MKYLYTIALILLIIVPSVLSYEIAYKKGFDFGLQNGYSRGQVDLSIELSKEIDEKVNIETDANSYYHFKDIHDITLYIYSKNEVKTMAIWDDSQ
jgi:hypothetical protein